ncbi:MAG TPA: argininosuccinate synthase [Candidatus Omnitrophota bacterium]|nr:argininosuccinate synthase [Candidatus Omnitrophota bacterium]HPD85341.1 argininosuccinate synthase [Candidatus Omnitrophota bacterium]HRZ04158.1 argininosuccinate synthase [Candidatus Omnitrophota bacterium]
MKKVVLAYSGGLDTSCAIKWLKDKGHDVIAYIADVGQGDDFSKIKTRALKTGASKVYVEDLKREFVENYICPTLKAGAIYEGKYLLATALSRPIIAKYQVQIAHKENATAIAHGCTGKGNDQVRFEVTARLLDPSLKIIAPVRVWEFKTRDEEIDYAKKKHIPIDVTKKSPYSIDKNIYGMSIECGILEDPWVEPPEEIYQMTHSPMKAPDKPTYIEIEFEKGAPKKINGKFFSPLALLAKLNEVGGKNGVGRADVIENRLVGIKSREIYEAPAGTILHIAHQELEALVLDRETLHYKQSIAQKYAEMVYYGLWETPLKKQLDCHIAKTQERVTGTIRLKLYKGNCIPVGRKSPFSLYREELATYGKKDVFDQKLAEGFIKIWGMPY